MRSKDLWEALELLLEAHGWKLPLKRIGDRDRYTRKVACGALCAMDLHSKMIGTDSGFLRMQVLWGSARVAQEGTRIFKVEENTFLTGGVVDTERLRFGTIEAACRAARPTLERFDEAIGQLEPEPEITRLLSYCPDGNRAGHRMAHLAALVLRGQTDVLDRYAEDARRGEMTRLQGLDPQSVQEAANSAWEYV